MLTLHNTVWLFNDTTTDQMANKQCTEQLSLTVDTQGRHTELQTPRGLGSSDSATWKSDSGGVSNDIVSCEPGKYDLSYDSMCF